MRKLATLFLVIVMVMSIITIPSFAEETTIQQADVQATVKNIIEVDGLRFKDLNSNGTLDVYEDWREDIEDRIVDLLSQMTLEEKSRMLIQSNMPANTGKANSDEIETAWYYAAEYNITHMLDNDGNGTPDEMAIRHNAVQEAAETTRLGIPVTVTSDRQYNAWAGYIDTAHDAMGTANDKELSIALWTAYAKEAAATGVHVTLQPYGVEIGSWYGEDPEYLAELSVAEVTSFNEQGIYACVKHFITRGGDSSFQSAHSIVSNIDNYIYPWEEVIKAGAKWIMTNSAGSGLDGLNVDVSAKTMNYLRDTLGYDGVVVTDWGSLGYTLNGVTEEGIDLGQLSNVEGFAYIINNGVDQLGINNVTLDSSEASGSCYDLTVMAEAVESALISSERLDEACARLLRTKFELNLFENPYSDPQEALVIAARAEYIANAWEITNIEQLDAARNQDVVQLERQLQAESAVLVKNDNVLPLAGGTKVYINSTNSSAVDEYKKYIANYGTVVENIMDADVVIADCTILDDAAELFVEDAKAAGKTLVIVANCVDPTAWLMESADALLFMNFTRIPDHGKAIEGFITTTEPSVYAEILFGVLEPSGIIVKEIARNEEMDLEQWKDLAGDQGASMDVRMIIEALMLSSETKSSPNNYGDPLLSYQFGMSYGQSGRFRYSSLVLPTYFKEVSVNLFLDFYETQLISTIQEQKANIPFTLYFILWNDGADDVTTVKVYDGDTVVAEKIMAVCGESWRIVKMDITLDGIGEHTLTVGDLQAVIVVEE